METRLRGDNNFFRCGLYGVGNLYGNRVYLKNQTAQIDTR